ncbi:MAG: LysE family translocator [Acidiferrobacterales bacterium]
MPEPSTLTLFIVAALALLVTPGPAVLYIVARSIEQGRVAGIVSTLGIATGSLFHIAAAALGVSAVLASSALAFNLLKYLGAAYLIYLGVRKFINREQPRKQLIRRSTLARIFSQGVLVNLLNPKTALFFLAFLPQFIDPAKGAAVFQMVLLGIIFVALGIASDGLYALLAGTAGNWLRGRARLFHAQRYLTGGVFIALGAMTALAGSEKTK